METVDVEKLMSFISHVHLIPFVLDMGVWLLSSLGIFYVKSFLLVLFNQLDPSLFSPTKLMEI